MEVKTLVWFGDLLHKLRHFAVELGSNNGMIPLISGLILFERGC